MKKTTTITFLVVGVSLLTASAWAKDRKAKDTQALLDELTAQLEAPTPVEVEPAVVEPARIDGVTAAVEAQPAEIAEPVETAAVAPVAEIAPEAAPAPAKAEPEAAPAKKGTPLRKATPIDDVGKNTASGPGLGYMIVGVFLLLMAGAAVWIKRRAAKGNPLGSHGRMKTLDVHRVAGKHSVALVSVAGRILVLGMGEKGLTLLTELDESELGKTQVTRPAAVGEAEPETGAGSFLARLNSLRDRFQAEPETKDPFQEALEESAPIDELVRLDERAAIRQRLEALRKRSA